MSWDHVQKSCALVSKKWFEFIRNNSEFSSKVAISEEKVRHGHISEYLQTSWPILKTLRINSLVKYPEKILSSFDYDCMENLNLVSFEIIEQEIFQQDGRSVIAQKTEFEVKIEEIMGLTEEKIYETIIGKNFENESY